MSESRPGPADIAVAVGNAATCIPVSLTLPACNIRLGVLGEWDNPYKTMDFGNEADELRALAALARIE